MKKSIKVCAAAVVAVAAVAMVAPVQKANATVVVFLPNVYVQNQIWENAVPLVGAKAQWVTVNSYWTGSVQVNYISGYTRVPYGTVAIYNALGTSRTLSTTYIYKAN